MLRRIVSEDTTRDLRDFTPFSDLGGGEEVKVHAFLTTERMSSGVNNPTAIKIVWIGNLLLSFYFCSSLT